MKTTVSIKIEKQLIKQLEKTATELHINSNELIEKAIEDYIYRSKVDDMRNRLNAYATQKGINTEEDLFAATQRKINPNT